MMDRMRELEERLNDHRRRGTGPQIHSIEDYPEEESDQHGQHEDHTNSEDYLASQVVEACLA
jgi:hypothetical protein